MLLTWFLSISIIIFCLISLYINYFYKDLRRKYPLYTVKQQKVDGYNVSYIAHKYGPEVPLLIFIHGLGARLQQWRYQIEHFKEIANVLAIDLPTLDHVVSLDKIRDDIINIIKKFQLKNNVLIGHSLGSAFCMFIAEKMDFDAIVLLSPRSTYSRLSPFKRRVFKVLLNYFPVCLVFLFNIYRFRNKKESIKRFIHDLNNTEVVKEQMSINCRSDSLNLLCYMYSILTCDISIDNIKSENLLVLAGEFDKITPVKSCKEVAEKFKGKFEVMPSGHNIHLEAHGLVNALIRKWLLSLGMRGLDPSYQIQKFSLPEYKWSLKNYKKWKRIKGVSDVIETKYFGIRAMKILRDGDDEHSPSELQRKYPKIDLVVDISHDRDIPYTPTGFKYVKVSTTSKIPPTAEEVKKFINVMISETKDANEVAIHCHYGFNRTGFMICTFLIEKCGMSVYEAIEKFALARQPGIKHLHFKEELYLRYLLKKES